MSTYHLSLHPVNSVHCMAKYTLWVGIKLVTLSSNGSLRFIFFLFLTHMVAFTNCEQFHYFKNSWICWISSQIFHSEKKNCVNKAHYKADFWSNNIFLSTAVEHWNLSECQHYCYFNIYHCNTILSNASSDLHPSNKAYHTLMVAETVKRLFAIKDQNTSVKELQTIASFSCF